MKAIQLQSPGGLDRLKLVDLPTPGAPQAGEIQVRVHASSLNYHDLGVVLGKPGLPDGLIPMADGRTKIRLWTRYHVATPVNGYTAMWGEVILGDIQENVLAIVAGRLARQMMEGQ